LLLAAVVVVARISAGPGFDLQSRFAAGVSFAFAADYLVPVRYGYVDILLVLPLALFMPVFTARRGSWVPLALMIAGLVAGHSLFMDLNISYWYPGTFGREAGLFLAFALALHQLHRRRHCNRQRLSVNLTSVNEAG
jgi:hypothetical protein